MSFSNTTKDLRLGLGIVYVQCRNVIFPNFKYFHFQTFSEYFLMRLRPAGLRNEFSSVLLRLSGTFHIKSDLCSIFKGLNNCPQKKKSHIKPHVMYNV